MLSATTLARGCSKGAVMTSLDTDNVRPLPVKTKRTDSTAALRQRRSRAKRKRVTPVPTTAVAQIAQPEKPSKIKADVTVARRAAIAHRHGRLHRCHLAGWCGGLVQHRGG